MNPVRHRAYLLAATILALWAPAIPAQNVSITVPDVGRVTLSFIAQPHSNNNFRSIIIRSAGKSVSFNPKYPIAHIPSNPSERMSRGLWDHISGVQLDPSRYFFRGDYISDSQLHTLFFFVGEGWASDAAPLLVIGFTYMGEPYKVLARDNFDMTSFLQASDNTALIIGKPTMSQIMGGDGGNGSKAPYATTYDPFSVFIVHVEGTAYYSLSASRRYNQERYVWAGQHSREDYAVAYNIPGHKNPFGTPASRIGKLVGGAAVPNLK